MNDEIDDIHNMHLDDLASKCAQETHHYFRHLKHNTEFCFELFRRAILESDEPAWTMLMAQYRPLLARWVNKWADKHPDFPLTSEDLDEFIAEGFEKFWKNYTLEKFLNAQSLASILSYLQLCTVTAVQDTWRKMRLHSFDQELDQKDTDEPGEHLDPTTTPEGDLQAKEFWELVKIKSNSQEEYIVIFASFNLSLSPREILHEYPNLFRNINTIYQLKANFLARLGRDSEFGDFRWNQ